MSGISIRVSLLFCYVAMISCQHKPESKLATLSNNPSNQLPRAVSPETRGSQEKYKPLFNGSAYGKDALAEVILLGTLMGLVYIANVPPKKTNDILGSCVYEEKGKSFSQAPCIHINAELLDVHHNVVVSTETNEFGDFRFILSPAEKYFIRVKDRKGRSSVSPKMIGANHKILLVLRP